MKRIILIALLTIVFISGCAIEEQEIINEHVDDPIIQDSEEELIEEENIKEIEIDDIIKNEVVEVIETEEQPIEEITTENECPLIFNYPPVNIEKTKLIVPLGLMSGNHVTPVDHQYFQDFENDNADIEVYSPGDGIIRSIGYMSGSYFDSQKNKDIDWGDYRIIIEHECNLESIYIHVDKISEKIIKELSTNLKSSYTNTNIKVNAGEIIGWYQNNVDYNVVDNNIILEGFVNPEHYEREPWKIHVPNTYEYFNTGLQKQLNEKSIRTNEPRSGKFDHDIDGKLIGNWFLENTNGYGGLNQDKYWVGHLSISPEHIVPEHFIVSMGDYDGKEEQFTVLENSPYPSNVDINSGMIKYELVRYDYITLSGESWDRRSLEKGLKIKNHDIIHGVILLEMIEDRKLKVEIFPDKDGSQVNGFTNNFKIYER